MVATTGVWRSADRSWCCFWPWTTPPVLVESTQFAKVVRAPGIRQIFALSPQAKGRVERMASTFQDRLVTELRLAGVSTIDQANDVLQEFLPRFNARFALAAEQPERAYRPVPAELSLTETISLKHTRKVARDNTVRYQWRVLQLLPEMDRPSYAGLQVDVLERADGQLMINYHGETVDFQESPQPLSSLWGATNPRSLGSQIQPHPRRSRQRPPQPCSADTLGLSAANRRGKGQRQKGSHQGWAWCGEANPPLSLHRTPTQAQQARWEAVQKAKRQGPTLLARYRPGTGNVPGCRHKIRTGGEPHHQTPKRQRACQGRGSGHIIDRRGLTTVTFSLFT